MAELRPVVLATGGTGGHVFPAEALAGELDARGVPFALVTDARGKQWQGSLANGRIHYIHSASPTGSLQRRLLALLSLGLGLVDAWRVLGRIDPSAVVGFGGYASVPTMFAASQLGVPTLIHEQNAVLGRANRLLASRVSRIATVFAETAGLRPGDTSRVVHTGNPVRPAILAAGQTDYTPPDPGRPIELLILGGSQGARIFSDVVPSALAALPPQLRGALRVSQQARPEDRDRAIADLQTNGITAEVETFFNDVPARLARAHLVICRSGASTVAELAATGRPALLVPYPHATDDHQAANARAFAEAGAGWSIPQSSLTPALLTERLAELLGDRDRLSHAAARARRFGCDDAAERLAALVLELAPRIGAHKRKAA